MICVWTHLMYIWKKNNALQTVLIPILKVKTITSTTSTIDNMETLIQAIPEKLTLTKTQCKYLWHLNQKPVTTLTIKAQKVDNYQIIIVITHNSDNLANNRTNSLNLIIIVATISTKTGITIKIIIKLVKAMHSKCHPVGQIITIHPLKKNC